MDNALQRAKIVRDPRNGRSRGQSIGQRLMQAFRYAEIFRFPLHVLVSMALLAGCVVLRVADPQPVSRLRLSAFDSYLRAAPRAVDPSFPVRVVAIDEASLARFGQWPWPRTTLADLTSRLQTAGAKSITFDLVLAEPDRLSPDALLRSLSGQSVSKDIISEIAKLPSNDERFAEAIDSRRGLGMSAPGRLQVGSGCHGAAIPSGLLSRASHHLGSFYADGAECGLAHFF